MNKWARWALIGTLGGLAGILMNSRDVLGLKKFFPEPPAPIVRVEEEMPLPVLPPLDDTYAVVAVGHNQNKEESREAINNALRYGEAQRRQGAEVKFLLENPYGLPIPKDANNETPKGAESVLRAIREIPSDEYDDIKLYFSADNEPDTHHLKFSDLDKDAESDISFDNITLNSILSQKPHRRIVTTIRTEDPRGYDAQSRYSIRNIMHFSFATEMSLGMFIDEIDKGYNTLDALNSVRIKQSSITSHYTPQATYYDSKATRFVTSEENWRQDDITGAIVPPQYLEEFVRENITPLVLEQISQAASYTRNN